MRKVKKRKKTENPERNNNITHLATLTFFNVFCRCLSRSTLPTYLDTYPLCIYFPYTIIISRVRETENNVSATMWQTDFKICLPKDNFTGKVNTSLLI